MSSLNLYNSFLLHLILKEEKHEARHRRPIKAGRPFSQKIAAPHHRPAGLKIPPQVSFGVATPKSTFFRKFFPFESFVPLVFSFFSNTKFTKTTETRTTSPSRSGDRSYKANLNGATYPKTYVTPFGVFEWF